MGRVVRRVDVRGLRRDDEARPVRVLRGLVAGEARDVVELVDVRRGLRGLVAAAGLRGLRGLVAAGGRVAAAGRVVGPSRGARGRPSGP